MKIRVLETQLFLHDLTLRIPFRYGIVTVTEVPHLFCRALVEVDGQRMYGIGADNLAPKWFTKNPATSFAHDREEMFDVIRHACAAAEEVGEHESVAKLWIHLHAAQEYWARTPGYPPLLWGFGVSLVERAIIDAFCKATGLTFAEAVRTDALGLDLADPSTGRRIAPAEFLPRAPQTEVIARHTVGLVDSLTTAEIPTSERVDDGLPQSLEECIRAYGLTHFKIKLSGQLAADRERLRALAGLLARLAPDCAFTLDGNEAFREVAPFRVHWEELRADPALARFFHGLLFVEQPLHRDIALSPATTDVLLGWKERPPIIIDESGGDLHALPAALAGGYAGTSHKNCKGVFHGLLDASHLAQCRRAEPARPFIQSGEDLINIGPIAMLQDLAVAATLGITHVERNGHHYFRGLSAYPASVQRAAVAEHGDLYRQHERGFPVLRVEGGRVSTRSILDAPFGSRVPIDPAGFTPLSL